MMNILFSMTAQTNIWTFIARNKKEFWIPSFNSPHGSRKVSECRKNGHRNSNKDEDEKPKDMVCALCNV